MPQEITDFLERRLFGEIVNVVAAMTQDTALAVEIADGRGRHDDVFEAALHGIDGHCFVNYADDSVGLLGLTSAASIHDYTSDRDAD